MIFLFDLPHVCGEQQCDQDENHAHAISPMEFIFEQQCVDDGQVDQVKHNDENHYLKHSNVLVGTLVTSHIEYVLDRNK